MSPSFALLVADDPACFADAAARKFIELLEASDRPLVTLPTGLTPQGFYRALVMNYADRRDCWEGLRFIALDEYCGLPANDDRLFSSWLKRAVLDPLCIRNRYLFDSAADPEQEIVRMQSLLEKVGPIDIAVLGLGANGHIAFNEPGTVFSSSIHVADLAPDTIKANARYWGREDLVPPKGMTLGLSDLSGARHTILLVTGSSKADVLKKALQGPVTTAVPASYLQKLTNVTVIADHAAAELL
ncbi:MAG: glucosamine-6-phosphate deaminase [Micavibrio aeruginosavorus]|uniref:Glucosamine-6-phosphate deaminase n=1 Tax=Micavibrio aeruginosavorus TaxID=349221 RepID=A0A7T5R366_9BACT|nr:MAG: glucosamine-6-phosphate deaminase [Micavibrio aeruginosavorus]